MNKKCIKSSIIILGMGIMLYGNSITTKAAFPSDLGEKPLKAYSIHGNDVKVYKDSKMTQETETVAGDNLFLEAVDVSGNQKALYGNYKNEETGESGKGWIKAESFLYEKSFKQVYATVRSEMTVYTSSSLSKVRTSIRKYSGIIALGKNNGAVQVIYEKEKNYGIGWLSAEDYDNKLIYDGRDKQLLADGDYNFTTAAEIEKEDVNSGQATVYPSMTYKLSYVGKKMYQIFDVKQNKYLKIQSTDLAEKLEDKTEEKPEWMEKGIIHRLKMLFVKSYKKKVDSWNKEEEEKKKERESFDERVGNEEIYEDSKEGLFYTIDWVEEKEDAGLFCLERHDGYFSISSGKSDLYLGNNSSQTMTLKKMEEPDSNYLWRSRAVAPLVDPSNPMVFTQYDPQWCGTDYGSEGCIGTAGCGLLATVNAVYALTGQYMSVLELRDYAVEKGYRIIGNGTDEGIFKAAANEYGSKYGYAWDGSSGDIKVLKKKLQAGDVAVVHVIGHYVAVTSYDAKKDKYLLLDSNCLPKRETSAFGDWISPSRLLDGYLYGQNYYFFKLEKDGEIKK